MRDYNNTLDAKFKMAEETKVNNPDQQLSYFDRLPSVFDNLHTNFGFLDALLTFGNTLELLYIGGMVFQPPTIVPSTISTMGSLQLEVKNTTQSRKQPLIPLYIDIKGKKCHQCSRPIVNYKHGLFCSNIYQGLENLNHACYKFVCKDCLGETWDFNKNNMLYKCLCCRGSCPPTSYCSTIERVRDNP